MLPLFHAFVAVSVPPAAAKAASHTSLRMKAASSFATTCPPALEGLEPESLWRNFATLSAQPRPSKGEEKVLQTIKDFADELGLEWKQDAVGNLVVYKPGSGGGESAPPVLVQAHVDMVTEANEGVQHDFWKDPIKLIRDGAWIKADGTTLGADNGIGAAACLALMEAGSDVALPPLECLFTVDEETGLTGAYDLDASMLKSKVMLNLDSEEWGSVTIGCAGGGNNIVRLPVVHEEPAAASVPMRITVKGLMGGHSGIDIHQYRGNAISMLVRALRAAKTAEGSLQVAGVFGGDKHNAIPRECSASAFVKEGKEEAVQKAVDAVCSELKREYGDFETNLQMITERVKKGERQVLSEESAEKLLSLLELLPNGVIKTSHVVEGLVETSNNLASVAPDPDSPGTYKVVASTRSSFLAALEAVRSKISALAKLLGASVEQDEPYAGWAPDKSSRVVELVRKEMEELTGKEVELKALHAGLECGVLGSKMAGLDMVSFGPTITGAHSPDERVQIETVKPFWTVLLRTLEKLAKA